MKVNYLPQLQAIVRQRGGECLSENYSGSYAKLRFRCAENHVFESTPRDIKMGRWCPKCRRQRKRQREVESYRRRNHGL